MIALPTYMASMKKFSTVRQPAPSKDSTINMSLKKKQQLIQDQSVATSPKLREKMALVTYRNSQTNTNNSKLNRSSSKSQKESNQNPSSGQAQ